MELQSTLGNIWKTELLSLMACARLAVFNLTSQLEQDAVMSFQPKVPVPKFGKSQCL